MDKVESMQEQMKFPFLNLAKWEPPQPFSVYTYTQCLGVEE